MENFIIYLGKASALLAIFYISYVLLLKRETSFQLNRKFLLGGIFSSVLLPLIYFTRKIYVEASTATFNVSQAIGQPSEITIEESLDWWYISGIAYSLITCFFLIRFGFQIRNVLKIIFNHNFEKREGLKFLNVKTNQLPFSFFSYVIYNPENHSENDLALILEHEKVHAKQMHSADIILANLLTSFFWFNPFSWLYKKAVEQNLEFIADKETVNKHREIESYQRALLKVSIGNMEPALTNHFYQSFIKKRILMLNKQSKSQSPAWKIGLLMPLLLAFMLLFNVKTEASIRNSENSKPVDVIESQEVGKSIIIGPKTTEESLDKLGSFFEDQGMVLKFTNVKYNDGNITSINSSLTNPVKGITRNYNQASSSGIKPFEVFLNRDGSMGYRTIEEAPTQDTANATMDLQQKFKEIGENPLYVINGKPVQITSLAGKSIKLNGPINVLTGVESTALYGSRGKDGTILITDGEILNSLFDDPSFKKNRNFSQNYISIDENGKPSAMSANTSINSEKRKNNWKIEPEVNITGIEFSTDETDEIRETLSSKNISGIIGFQNISRPSEKKHGLTNKDDIFINLNDDTPQQEKPLIVLNGKVQKADFNMENLDVETIANIKVIKGNGAIRKYGEKGEPGVIEIATMDHAGNYTNSGDIKMHVLHKNQDDESLKRLQKMIRKDANIKTEFSNVKRNSEGIITAIMVKAESKSGKKSSATFSNSEGIPMIAIGLDNKDRLIISSQYDDN